MDGNSKQEEVVDASLTWTLTMVSTYQVYPLDAKKLSR